MNNKKGLILIYPGYQNEAIKFNEVSVFYKYTKNLTKKVLV